MDCPWHFPGKNTGVGFHFLLQGIFPNPGIEPMSSALDSFTTEPPGEQLPTPTLQMVQMNLFTKQ